MDTRLASIRAIVTHPGQAHRDEFMAVGLVLTQMGGEIPTIERRDPTPEDLADPSVLVIDCGGRHEPDLANFDHHQLERGTVACALTLVAEWLGLDTVLQLQDWYRPTAYLDSCGPFALAKELGLPRFPSELWSPLEEAILRQFEHDPLVAAPMMETLLWDVLSRAESFAQDIETVRTQSTLIPLGPFEVLLFDGQISPKATGAYRKQLVAEGHDVGVLVTHDDPDRGKGWQLYRYEDNPAVDFSQLSGDPGVLFAHPGGFIAKTRERCAVESALELVKQALVSGFAPASSAS